MYTKNIQIVFSNSSNLRNFYYFYTMNIVFSKDDHKYQAGERVYTSVSKLISKYKNEFDSDHWSTYKAIEKVMGEDNFRQLKKGWDVSKEEFILHAMNYVNGVDVAKARKKILKEWDQKNKKSIKRGNAYHDVREKRSYKKDYPGYCKNHQS